MPGQEHELTIAIGHDAQSILEHYASMLKMSIAEYIEQTILGYRPPLTAYFKRYLREHHPDAPLNLYTLEKAIDEALPGITEAEKQTIIGDMLTAANVSNNYGAYR